MAGFRACSVLQVYREISLPGGGIPKCFPSGSFRFRPICCIQLGLWTQYDVFYYGHIAQVANHGETLWHRCHHLPAGFAFNCGDVRRNATEAPPRPPGRGGALRFFRVSCGSGVWRPVPKPCLAGLFGFRRRLASLGASSHECEPCDSRDTRDDHEDHRRDGRVPDGAGLHEVARIGSGPTIGSAV